MRGHHLFAGMGHLLPVPPAQSPRWAPLRGTPDLPLPEPGLLECSGGEAEAHVGHTNPADQPAPSLASPAATQGACVYISPPGQTVCPEHTLGPSTVLPGRCTGQTDEFLDRRQLKFGLQCQILMSQLVLCLNHKSSSLDTAETHNSVPHPGTLHVSFATGALLPDSV